MRKVGKRISGILFCGIAVLSLLMAVVGWVSPVPNFTTFGWMFFAYAVICGACGLWSLYTGRGEDHK